MRRPKLPKDWFSNVLLCDDVRKEDNGKLIIIGVYTGDVIVQSFPATLGMRVYGEYRPSKGGPSDLQIRYYTGDTETASMKGRFDFPESGPYVAALTLPPVPIQIAEETDISIRVEADGYAPVEVLRKHVTLGASPTA